MVNRKLAAEREFRIGEVLKLLKQLKKKGKIISDRRNFIMQICVNYNVQQRKASEYLKVAEFMLNNE